MIKEAINEFKSVVEANKARAVEKYESKSRPAGGGAVSRLKNTAADFMRNEERQKDYRGDWFYENKNLVVFNFLTSTSEVLFLKTFVYLFITRIMQILLIGTS